MANKRKPRSRVSKQKKIDILKPLDIFSLGTDKDPCFGKYHDLKATECISCGDSEFCSIVTTQNLHKKRLSVEAEKQMKDLDEAEQIEIDKIKKAKESIKELKSLNRKKMKVIIKVSKEFNLTKDKVKELYNQI